MERAVKRSAMRRAFRRPVEGIQRLDQFVGRAVQALKRRRAALKSVSDQAANVKLQGLEMMMAKLEDGRRP